MTTDVADALAIGRSHGIAGFEQEATPPTSATHAPADFALATRLGLPGFEAGGNPTADKSPAGGAR